MGFGDLLKKVKKGKEALERVKSEIDGKKEQSSGKSRSKADKILSGISDVLTKAEEIEKNGTSIGDLVGLGGDALKDKIKGDKAKDIIGGVQDVLKDGKVDKDELINEGLDVAEKVSDNDTVKDIIGDIGDVAEDGKVEVDELVDKGLENVAQHSQKGKIKDIAKAARQILKDGKTDVQEVFGVAADVFKEEIEKAGLTDIVKYTEGFLEGVNSLEDLLEKGKKELERLAKEAAKELINSFINKFLNKGIRKELITIKHRPARHKWGRLSMGMEMDIALAGELSGEFTGEAVIIRTALGALAYAEGDLTIDTHFTIPVIDKEIDGELILEVKGDLACSANAELELKVKDMALNGELKKTLIETNYDMILYATIPDWIVDLWNGAAKWSFGYLDPIDETFTYKIGEYQLFKIEVPGYQTSFSLKTMEFSGGVNGNYRFVEGKDVALIVRKVEKVLPWE